MGSNPSPEQIKTMSDEEFVEALRRAQHDPDHEQPEQDVPVVPLDGDRVYFDPPSRDRDVQ